jgi:hypothetical protein
VTIDHDLLMNKYQCTIECERLLFINVCAKKFGGSTVPSVAVAVLASARKGKCSCVNVVLSLI